MIVRGVYLNHNRNSAVVLQVKEDGTVIYLTFKDGPIEAHKTSDISFARQWPIFLHDYPLSKAIRSYASSGLKASDAAVDILRKLLNPKAAQRTKKAKR